MALIDQGSSLVSLEQVRAAFSGGTATGVRAALVPFLVAEWRSNGDRRVINEVAESIGRVVYAWFQSSEAMDAGERLALYQLLRPDGVVVETLLQYNAQSQSQWMTDVAGDDLLLAIGMDSLPPEWRGKEAAVAAYLKAHVPLGVRVVESAGAVSLRVGALEYVVYHICRALVPAPGLGVRHGSLVAGSVVHSLARELISFFLPVAEPDPERSGIVGQFRRPMDPERSGIVGQLRRPIDSERTHSSRPDLLDACSGGQAKGVAQWFAFCAGLAWLPTGADAAAGWAPRIAHVAGLNLFHAAIGYVARGERQLERVRTGGHTEGTRVAMNASVRDVVRHHLAGPLGATLALAVAASRRPGAADTADAWLPFLDEVVSTWIRYAMPWRGSRTADAPSANGGLSGAWQQRVRLVVWRVGAPLYAPVLADIAKLASAPHVDLLLQAPRSAIGDASALAHLREADALGVVERIASAFAPPELRAILVAADRLWGLSHGPSLLSSPRFDALAADATRLLVEAPEHAPPPIADASIFASPHSALIRGLVTALQRADGLCKRQLRLLAPPPVRAAEQAQTLVADLFAAASRAFLAAPPDAPTTAESAAVRSQALHAAQERIAAVVPKLAAVFHASRTDIAALMRESAPFARAATACSPPRLPATSPASPDMVRGSLTPRGRWELKTGRRKFTAMSLVTPPVSAPRNSSTAKHGGDDDDALLPRGPRAVSTARSYESQWLLDHALRLNVIANPFYKRALDFAEEVHLYVPPFARTANIDFRWAASYPNLRFLALVLCLLLLVRYLFS
ncbi:hypothetical protein GGI20_001327 [Coemansia sp. BCRC 34301]|nr:hypothetical protein GGI20_001327 [Coemansia sp. BCRC 34301]